MQNKGTAASSQTKRVRSTARRIAHSYLLRLLLLLLVLNVVVVGSVLLYAAVDAEKTALGSAWQAQLVRRVDGDNSLPLVQRLQSVVYVFQLPGDAEHAVAAGKLLTLLYRGMYSLLVAEAILLFFSYRGAKRRVMYLLTPLRQMAQAAQQFSDARFDEQKFHTLEDAIERLSVQSPGARLTTRDNELSGLETAINNLLTRMHEAYRQQIRFVSDASHELRTPIAVIRGYADLLSRWGKDDEKVMQESVTAIKGEADNMQRLVEQLLFLARGDAGRQAFSQKRVDLTGLARETHEEYALIDKEHTWRLREGGPVWALGDVNMLKQALRVLSDNARKYSKPDSAITLRTYTNEQGMPCMSVQDNGLGIAPQDLPHIFERFYRSDPARGRGGTGLGLAIAKWIVDRHQGYLDVTSLEGLGTRFTIVLPKPTPEQWEQSAKQAEDSPTLSEETAAQTQGEHIANA